ncbi:hypothetical protein E2C01_043086 [Portunus trituberculatus]|uniref:Uncharacterized protein n=1 Tax=Portunus trituberculatus TaxID=210409 RepID=A0A5B7FWJ4_PORTR|nr:hypothetical protein [Portunus trituberculatus]
MSARSVTALTPLSVPESPRFVNETGEVITVSKLVFLRLTHPLIRTHPPIYQHLSNQSSTLNTRPSTYPATLTHIHPISAQPAREGDVTTAAV